MNVSSVTVTVSGAAPSSLSAPVLLPASGITKNSFTINWEAVENADGYLLDVVAGDSTGLPTRAARDAEGTWTLVTDVSTLAAGDQIIIASATDAYAISTTQQSNNRAGTAIVKDGSTLETPASAVAVLTLGEGSVSDTWSFYDEANNGYLYAASSSQNHLKTEGSLSGNSSWSITIATDGEATVVAQGSNTRNNLRFNPNGGNPIFSCYADSSTMAKVCLYKFVASGSGASSGRRGASGCGAGPGRRGAPDRGSQYDHHHAIRRRIRDGRDPPGVRLRTRPERPGPRRSLAPRRNESVCQSVCLPVPLKTVRFSLFRNFFVKKTRFEGFGMTYFDAGLLL